MRPYFPQQTAQGQKFSPVDDARFKAGIPSDVKNTVDPHAITLGLYDIHYDSNRVDINGGDVESLRTIVEEVAHTVQFLQVWDSIKSTFSKPSKLALDQTR